MAFSRRDWMMGVGAGSALAGLSGCVDWTRRLGAQEHHKLQRGPRPVPIVQWRRGQPDWRSVLRQRAYSARNLGPQGLALVDERMRETLKQSGGVGLAGPQVGLARRVFLVQLQRRGKPVLFCADPVFTWMSRDEVDGYEACLSIQGVGGLVRRSQAVDVTYYDTRGQRQRLRSTGWEARIFQHELDHLDGVLYLDRLVGPLLPLDEVRRLRKQRKRASHLASSPRYASVRLEAEGPWVL